MDSEIDRLIEAFGDRVRAEINNSTDPDDVAGALLELGAELTIASYGPAQTAELLHRLAAVLERGVE